MGKAHLIYSGNSKKVFSTDDAGTYILESTDRLPGGMKGSVKGRGACNTKISARLFDALKKAGIPNHFEKLVSDTEIAVKKLEMLPLTVVVSNMVSASLAKRLGLEEGVMLESPVLEFYMKNATLQSPMVNEYHIRALNLARDEQVERIKELAFKANGVMRGHLGDCGILLVDSAFEFGLHDGKITLGDEISPDTCTLMDAETREKLGRDSEPAVAEEAYLKALKKIVGDSDEGKNIRDPQKDRP